VVSTQSTTRYRTKIFFFFFFFETAIVVIEFPSSTWIEKMKGHGLPYFMTSPGQLHFLTIKTGVW
jgi:hypothetical protein